MRKVIEKIHFNKTEIIVLVFLTIIFSIPLFSSFILEGDDIYFHLNRISGIGNALRDGQFLPKIYPLTNFEFGYAIPLFYSDIFMYPAAILYIVGFSLINSYKLILFMYIVLGNIMMYYFSKKIFKDNTKVIVILMFVYSLNPYRYIDAFYRASFSEFMALTFFPLVIYAFYEVFYMHKNRFILLAFAMASLLLSHNLSFILFVILYVVLTIIYIIFNKDKFKNILMISIKAGIIGFLITSFFTLPMLEQLFSQDFKVSEYTNTYDIQKNIVNIWDILHIFNYTNIKDFGMINIHRYGIGVLSIILPFFNFKFYKNKWILMLTIIHYLLIALACGLIPIYSIDFFNMLQFSFRFYILIYFTSIVVVSYAIYKVPKYIKYICFSILLINISLFNYNYLGISPYRLESNLYYNDIFEYNENQYFYDNKQTGAGEYLPIMKLDDYIFDTNKIVEVIDGDKYYTDIVFDRYMTNINFTYNSSGDDILLMPLTYYKGYSIVASNSDEIIKIEAKNHDIYKKVTVNTIEGEWNYNIKYVGTLIQHLSLLVSIISIFALIIWQIKRIKYKFKAS